MKKTLALILIICCFSSLVNAQQSSQMIWENNLQNGYISTKPLIVDDQIIVRTSGFWTSSDRPHVYSFDIETGEENWRFRSNGSTNHDLSPLLYVESSSGECGSWPDLVLVGWTDGILTALHAEDGSIFWQYQTQNDGWGITGSMALDEDKLVVPTSSGLSTFCLANGTPEFELALNQQGWRNGVSIHGDNYIVGNELGKLYSISKDGVPNLIHEYNGKIRHAPVVSDAGIIVHVQTNNGSEIYVDSELISAEGPSPAIPIIIENKVYLGTSSHILVLDCLQECSIAGRTEYKTNGEITEVILNSESTISFPKNDQIGGWGIGEPGQSIETIFSEIGTYTTAGLTSTPDGKIVFGNDNGVLYYYASQNKSTLDESGNPALAIMIVAILSITIFPQVFKRNIQLGQKMGLFTVLILMILLFPQFANYWSEEVDKFATDSTDWDPSWPNEWQGTQVVVIELENETILQGGLSGYSTVEEITSFVAGQNQIIIDTETYDFGSWVVSFDGQFKDSWEFTIDGKRSSVGFSQATIEQDSVVRWKPA